MDWKKIGKKLLFPPIWLMVILVLVSAVTLTLVFVGGMEQSIPAYIVYVLAFYTLSVVTLFCVMVLPKQYSTIKRKIYDNPFGNRYIVNRYSFIVFIISASDIFVNSFFQNIQCLVTTIKSNFVKILLYQYKKCCRY